MGNMGQPMRTSLIYIGIKNVNVLVNVSKLCLAVSDYSTDVSDKILEYFFKEPSAKRFLMVQNVFLHLIKEFLSKGSVYSYYKFLLTSW